MSKDIKPIIVFMLIQDLGNYIRREWKDVMRWDGIPTAFIKMIQEYGVPYSCRGAYKLPTEFIFNLMQEITENIILEEGIYKGILVTDTEKKYLKLLRENT